MSEHIQPHVTHTHSHSHTHAHTPHNLHTTHTTSHTRIHTCMRMYTSICMLLHKQNKADTHTTESVCAVACTRESAVACPGTVTCTYRRTHIHLCVYTRVHTSTYRPVLMNTHRHGNLYIQTHHTYIHTYFCTCMKNTDTKEYKYRCTYNENRAPSSHSIT